MARETATSSTLRSVALTVDDLRTSSTRRAKERGVRAALLGAALASLVISALIVVSLIGEAASFVNQVELSTLFASGWFPRDDEFDLRTIFVGTLIVTIIAMVLAVPTGMGAAIYLSEYASPRVRKVLKPVLEILAGIPSVVLGFFALAWISPEVIQRLFSGATQSNLLAAGIGVGILTIPLVASVSEDAMSAVPGSLREASYGMGARKITTVVRVVLPASVSGLAAAFILAVSRAMGETMVVVIAAGGSGGTLFSLDPTKQGLTMTAAMATQARGTDAVVGSGLTFQSLFFVGLLLFLITLTLNVVAGRFVRRVQERY